MTPQSMDDLALACDDVARFSSRLKKIAIVARFLDPLPDDDFVRAVRFFCCQPVETDRKGLAIGGATLRDAIVAVTGYDAELIRICGRECGDSAETISLLLHNRSLGEPMNLKRAAELFSELHGLRRTAAKVEALQQIFVAYYPTTIKYFLKIITGDLRIGLQEKLVEEAVAASTQQPIDDVRQASNRSGDLAQVALAARRGELNTIEARLFQPMDFMLARPLDSLANLPDPEAWHIEDKYDGIRIQAHADAGKVKLFSRGMDDVTGSYPDLVLPLAQLPRSAVIDGELLAWRDGQALPFNVLQQRLARKVLKQELIDQIPVSFMAYDLLYEDGHLLLDTPIEERRARLSRLFEPLKPPLLLSPQWTAPDIAAIDRHFGEARSRRNEGLLLKRRGSLYEGGKRGGAWMKVKRPFATLDVVVTAAEQGRGRRATMLSDYTFGVRHGDRYVTVGKAYSGLTDEEIRELTRLLRSIATERFGRVILVRPEVVLEVAFDGIQLSPRHKSGFAMRFPRIVRWRKDKRPEEADDLERVRELYDASL